MSRSMACLDGLTELFASSSVPSKSDQHLRERALALAESGQFNHWEEIGHALIEEGLPLALEHLAADETLRRMQNARCASAQRK